MTRIRAGLFLPAGAALALALAAAPLGAQATVPAAGPAPRSLTLDEALRLGEAASEPVAIARAGITRARGQQYQARAERFPQLSATLGYTRALRSEFESLGGESADTTFTGPDPSTCGRFAPNPLLPLEQRVDSLEHALDCTANGNPFAGLGDLPFGRKNTYQAGLTLGQTVFAGGRVTAQGRAAEAGRASAEINLASARAQLALDVTEAYFNAALAGRLVQIAEATLEQAERTLRQAQLAREVGNQPEFDVLRAQVARDNQRPVVIQRRSDRDLAYLRLKQLVNLPLDTPIELATPLSDTEPVPVAQFVSGGAVPGDTANAVRAPVRQAEQTVVAQEQQLRIARSQRFPTVRVSSNYGRLAYPTGGIPGPTSFNRVNWTVGASLSVPIFTGGRIRGDELVAEAGVAEAKARLQQTQELATLDTRSALDRLEAAQAAYQASAGTVEQAQRAYQIAEVRFAEGISTQLELADARLLLQQAEANRALAARDLQVARVRVQLLPDLPLQVGTSGFGQGAVLQQQQQQFQQGQGDSQQTQSQQAPQGAASTSQAGVTGAGAP
jgi:outer membrane protein TolC